MNRFLIPLLLMAATAFAEPAPIVVIGGENTRPASEIEHERVLQNFPEWAVTNAAVNTTGQNRDVVTSPPAPAAAPTAPVPQSAAPPQAPASPAAPASKLWPIDTVPIFMPPCVGYQPTLIAPCRCVIGRLMLEMPHDEFLKLSAQGTIEQDARLHRIRLDCAAAPNRKAD